MQFVSERLRGIQLHGGIYDIYQKALKLEANGKKIVHMEIGRPDFDSPDEAKDAVVNAIKSGKVYYTTMAGIPELRKAICDMEFRNSRIAANPENEIVVTAGACEALISVMMATLNHGDEIMIPAPYFGAYSNMADIVGIIINEVPLGIENGFILRVEDLEKKYNPKVKALLINTPNNPTGAVIPRENLEKIAEFAKEKDLLVISDETYSQFIFEGEHTSISTLGGMKERTIVVSSASKLFSMTGWRVGYAILPKEIFPYVNKVHENMSTCSTSFAQYGVTEAYNNCEGFTKVMLKEFKKRREIIVNGLSICKGLQYSIPKGAFYIMVRIKDTGLSCTEFAERLLNEAGIAVTPGIAFGNAGKDYIRFSFGCSRDDIVYAMKKLKEFTDSL